MTPSGQPYQPQDQRPQWQNPTPPPTPGYPEPDGNYLTLQQTPAGPTGFVRQSRTGVVVLVAIIVAVLVVLMALGLVLFTVPVS